MEQLITNLSKIYNTLCLIDTRGENTRNMAACLNALHETIELASNMAAAPEVIQEKEKKTNK